jgi:glycerophosphoryl diester phosphodiesterase
MWTYPRVLAHRGGGTLAPENTIAALRCAVALEFRAVEFDVMAVRDGGLVLIHDPVLGRTVRGRIWRARLKVPQDRPVGFYHCVSRIVDRVFRLEEVEKEHFVKLMREYEEFCEVRVLTY